MVLFNYSIREITAKIVYYGPGLGGKTTNLQTIHKQLDPNSRGKLISLATDADRTLFFDFLPLDLGRIGGYRVRFQLYTVPGQVHYNATRKLVLKGVDAIVFVADAQVEMLDRNRESYDNLKENLMENGYDLSNLPIIFQFNKQDLPNVATREEVAGIMGLEQEDAVIFEAVATEGRGVFEGLKSIIKMSIDKLRNQFEDGQFGIASQMEETEPEGRGIGETISDVAVTLPAEAEPAEEVIEETRLDKAAPPPEAEPGDMVVNEILSDDAVQEPPEEEPEDRILDEILSDDAVQLLSETEPEDGSIQEVVSDDSIPPPPEAEEETAVGESPETEDVSPASQPPAEVEEDEAAETAVFLEEYGKEEDEAETALFPGGDEDGKDKAAELSLSQSWLHGVEEVDDGEDMDEVDLETVLAEEPTSQDPQVEVVTLSGEDGIPDSLNEMTVAALAEEPPAEREQAEETVEVGGEEPSGDEIPAGVEILQEMDDEDALPLPAEEEPSPEEEKSIELEEKPVEIGFEPPEDTAPSLDGGVDPSALTGDLIVPPTEEKTFVQEPVQAEEEAAAAEPAEDMSPEEGLESTAVEEEMETSDTLAVGEEVHLSTLVQELTEIKAMVRAMESRIDELKASTRENTNLVEMMTDTFLKERTGPKDPGLADQGVPADTEEAAIPPRRGLFSRLFGKGGKP